MVYSSLPLLGSCYDYASLMTFIPGDGSYGLWMISWHHFALSSCLVFSQENGETALHLAILEDDGSSLPLVDFLIQNSATWVVFFPSPSEGSAGLRTLFRDSNMDPNDHTEAWIKHVFLCVFYFIIRLQEVWVILPGLGTAAARAALSILTRACSVFVSNSGMTASIWDS